MTLDELKQLDNKYGESQSALDDIYDLIKIKKSLKFDDRISDTTIQFWSRILDNITDDYVKELVYEVFSEYIFYCEKDVFCGADEWDEISEAYLDDRLFIFPFKPGDFICKKYSNNPEKIISITMYNASCYPVINTELRHIVNRVEVIENEIDYHDIIKYKKVDNIETYDLYDEFD